MVHVMQEEIGQCVTKHQLNLSEVSQIMTITIIPLTTHTIYTIKYDSTEPPNKTF